MIARSQVTSDSVRVDSNRYCFNESQVKEIIKTKIDLTACDSISKIQKGIINNQEEQKKELQNRINALVEENKSINKKKNSLKWAIGSTSVVLGGIIIYAIIRK